MSSVPTIPEQHMPVVPSVIVNGGSDAIAFYERAFGARCISRMDGPDGVVFHAELVIGRGLVFVADEYPSMGLRSPKSLGGNTGSYTVYVDDPDGAHARAVGAGATSAEEVSDGFHGFRSGAVTCPFGHRWIFARQMEVLTAEEITRRMGEWMASQPGVSTE